MTLSGSGRSFNLKSHQRRTHYLFSSVNGRRSSERWTSRAPLTWIGLTKPLLKEKGGMKKASENKWETEKIVTLVHHESSWSSTHQAQLGLLVEMQQIKTTHMFQNPWVREDKTEGGKENRFDWKIFPTARIFMQNWGICALHIPSHWAIWIFNTKMIWYFHFWHIL